jgi:hypothetical protein
MSIIDYILAILVIVAVTVSTVLIYKKEKEHTHDDQDIKTPFLVALMILLWYSSSSIFSHVLTQNRFTSVPQNDNEDITESNLMFLQSYKAFFKTCINDLTFTSNDVHSYGTERTGIYAFVCTLLISIISLTVLVMTGILQIPYWLLISMLVVLVIMYLKIILRLVYRFIMVLYMVLAYLAGYLGKQAIMKGNNESFFASFYKDNIQSANIEVEPQNKIAIIKHLTHGWMKHKVGVYPLLSNYKYDFHNNLIVSFIRFICLDRLGTQFLISVCTLYFVTAGAIKLSLRFVTKKDRPVKFWHLFMMSFITFVITLATMMLFYIIFWGMDISASVAIFQSVNTLLSGMSSHAFFGAGLITYTKFICSLLLIAIFLSLICSLIYLASIKSDNTELENKYTTTIFAKYFKSLLLFFTTFAIYVLLHFW